jgi:hypothetical protein
VIVAEFVKPTMQRGLTAVEAILFDAFHPIAWAWPSVFVAWSSICLPKYRLTTLFIVKAFF